MALLTHPGRGRLVFAQDQIWQVWSVRMGLRSLIDELAHGRFSHPRLPDLFWARICRCMAGIKLLPEVRF
jgi:hypothetical protein